MAATGASQLMWHGHVPAAVPGLKAIGQPSATKTIHLTFSLPLRNQPELENLLRELYDPASPHFRQYLTPAEFTERFGPSEADYSVLLEFVRTNGFQIVGTHPNRVLVDVAGSVATVERVFGVTLRNYRHPREARNFFAPATEPSLVAPVTLLDVSGLDDYSLPHPGLKPRPLAASLAVTPLSGSGSGGSYLGNDFRAAYVPGTTLTGAGQSVGLLQYDGYYASDIASYINQAGIATSVVLTNIPINGGVSTPGSDSVEVSLDIEMAIAMAPGLSRIYVYEAPNGSTAWSSILSRMANDNLARQLSSSWFGGGPDSASEQIFKQMAAQGQSFFNASGDSDAFTGAVSFPCDSTNITLVGGTTLSTTGPGGAYLSETVWNWGGGTGSSGGVSTYYKIPKWQTNINMTANAGSTTYRNIPDVALTGDNIYVVHDNGGSGIYGGTSCAAPLWAGYCALINEQAALAVIPPVGFLNPTLYAMANTASYNYNFHDVTTGDNTSSTSSSKYYAVAGYDLCTGLGTPNGTNLINALAPLVFAPAIAGGGWQLFAESATPTNGAIDPGETVTVSFALQNNGNLATTNLTATLQASANVLAPGGAQTYGMLAAFGGSTSRAFTFTTAGTCGSNIITSLQLQNGTNNLGTVSFSLPFGKIFGLSQDFDGVTAPNLPPGWTNANVSGPEASWMTTTTSRDTVPNSAFIAEPVTPGQNALVTPGISISTASAQLSFRHNYSLEFGGNGFKKTYYDGGVLEIQIGNGAFTDILTAGGSFVSGGYNHTITTSSDNPLGGRSAWGGSSGGWLSVVVNLPAAASGQIIHIRWNCATDTSNAGTSAVGWYVDSVSITDAAASCLSVFTDIAAGQSLATSSLQSGQNLVYTLSVTNLGPQPAANVILTDTVPANVTFVSASPGCTYSAGRVVCPAGMLAAAAFTNFTVALAPSDGSVFTNLLNASTVTPEVTTANNTAALVAAQVAQTPAVISVGPAAQSIQCGSNVSFTIVPSGTPPLAIQWWSNSLPIAGATNTSLLLTNVHMPAPIVAVTVTNLYGSAISNALLTVDDTLPPVITLDGINPTIIELGSAFTNPGVTVSDLCAGLLAVTTNGVVNPNITGTNTLTYTANDGNGNTNIATRVVIVRDTTPPAIAWSFTNLVLAANTNCVGLMPDVTGTNFIIATDLSGALTISQSPTDGEILSLGTNLVIIVFNDASGNAAYSTNCIVVQDQAPPEIFNQPQSQTNLAGTTAKLNAGATACTPLTWQWFFNNAPLDNQTNGTLTMAPVSVSNAGDYFVVASASGGSSTSIVATLTVDLIPPGVNGVAFIPDGGFNLNLTGTPGYTYILQSTTNLAVADGWLSIATNTIDTNGVWLFADPSATNYPQQFYRLKLAE